MKKCLTLLTFCLLSVAMFANKEVSGVVVDEKNEPVIGVSVQIPGTNLGTITDMDGAFSISVPDDAKTAIFSAIGMKSVELALKKVMHVVLQENVEQLQDVVVTGFGNVSKGSYAGSAQAVNAENIEKKASTEISKALAGEIAGMQVINGSGQPGSNATIRIRGVGSIYGNSAPLYIVDGVTYDGDISSIDPGDIASTTVLKDATATSLYGARGANGVIVITTKKGNSGDEGHIDVNVNYGANMRLLPMYQTISSPEEYVLMAWQSIYNAKRFVNRQEQEKAINSANKLIYSSGGLPTGYNLWDMKGKDLVIALDADGNLNPTFNPEAKRRPGYENLESWKDAIFRVGQKVDANVKVHGGSEKVKYYTSVGYLMDEGYYQASDYNRFTLRSNVDFEPKKWLKGNVNVAYAYSQTNQPNQDGDGAMNNGFYYVNAVPAIYPVYLRDENGNIPTDPRTGLPTYDYGNEHNRSFGFGINPAGSLRLDKENYKQHEVDAKGNLEFKLYKGLKFILDAGVHYNNTLGSELTNKFYGDAAGIGRIYQESSNLFTISARQMLEYNNTIGDHTFRVMAGHENYLYQLSYIYGYKSYLADPSSLELSNGVKMNATGGSSTRFANDGYFASGMYNYNERYAITANYRADGSSRYAKGHRWGHFGSVGVRWNFTNESFLKDYDEWLHDANLRLSWGVLGNEVNSLYSYANLYSIENVDDSPAYIESSKGNPNITWERSNMVNLGLDFGLHKYLDVELEYYYKLTDQMVFPRAVAPSLGYSSIPSNDAKMVNTGVELSLHAHLVDTRNVKLNLNINGAHYRNYMTQMPLDYIDGDGVEHRMHRNGAMSLGHSNWDHYTVRFLGVNPETGLSMFEGFYDDRYGEFGDKKDDGTYNYVSSLYDWMQQNPNQEGHLKRVETENYSMAADQYGDEEVPCRAKPGLRSYLPDFAGGFSLDLDVYGVTLYAGFSYQIGGYGYDYTYMALMDDKQVGNHNWHIDMLKSWTETNTNTDIPGLFNGLNTYSMYTNAASTRFQTSNSYLSLNNVQIGYNFPKKLIQKIKLEKLHLYVSGSNLAIATARKGYNPMTSFTGSSDTHAYSPLSTIMGGIKLSF